MHKEVFAECWCEEFASDFEVEFEIGFSINNRPYCTESIAQNCHLELTTDTRLKVIINKVELSFTDNVFYWEDEHLCSLSKGLVTYSTQWMVFMNMNWPTDLDWKSGGRLRDIIEGDRGADGNTK